MVGSWIEAANREPMLIERIRALLRMDDGISFAELDQLDGFPGDQVLLDGDANRVLWPWVSEEAATALALLIARGECHITGASLFTYLCDGRIPSLPIAKTERPYIRPRWVPAVLRRGRPAPDSEPRQAARRPGGRRSARGPRKRRLIPGKLRARG